MIKLNSLLFISLHIFPPIYFKVKYENKNVFNYFKLLSKLLPESFYYFKSQVTIIIVFEIQFKSFILLKTSNFIKSI